MDVLSSVLEASFTGSLEEANPNRWFLLFLELSNLLSKDIPYIIKNMTKKQTDCFLKVLPLERKLNALLSMTNDPRYLQWKEELKLFNFVYL